MAARQVPGECRHMRVQLKHCWMMVLLCLITSEVAAHSIPQGSSNPDSRPQVSQPPAEWTRVVPGGKGTSCSDGSRYSFFVRAGDPKRLLIYFQGGGACWSAATCDFNQNLYRANLDDVVPQTELGIFDFSNTKNPFHDYTVVFIPYCTGDAHLGSRTVTYRLPGSENSKPRVYTVRHNGYANASAVLRWISAKFSPDQIFVAGGSAGAIASPFYTGRIAEKYTHSKIIQLGDSAGGLRSPLIPSILNTWGTTHVVRRFRQYRGQGSLTFEKFYVVEGGQQPSVVFSQFNNSQDAVQIAGLRQVGVEKFVLGQLLELTYSDIGKSIPKFCSFTAPGTLHVMLNRREFYALEVRGVRLRDWVADLASGRTVRSVNP